MLPPPFNFLDPPPGEVIRTIYTYYSLLDVPQVTTRAVFLLSVLYVGRFCAVNVFTARQKLNIMVHAPNIS